MQITDTWLAERGGEGALADSLCGAVAEGTGSLLVLASEGVSLAARRMGSALRLPRVPVFGGAFPQ